MYGGYGTSNKTVHAKPVSCGTVTCPFLISLLAFPINYIFAINKISGSVKLHIGDS